MQNQDEIDTTSQVLPISFDINFHDDYMQITRTWFSLSKFLLMLVFVLIFNGVWISNGFLEILTSDRELLLKLFALVFIIIGAALVYYSIATFFNKTQILVSRDVIEIKHHPLPWFGNKRVETNNIKQLFVKEKYRGSSNNNPRLSYNVLGLTKEDKPFNLLTDLEFSNQALYIEQEVEKYLGIENMEVSGEIG